MVWSVWGGAHDEEPLLYLGEREFCGLVDSRLDRVALACELALLHVATHVLEQVDHVLRSLVQNARQHLRQMVVPAHTQLQHNTCCHRHSATCSLLETVFSLICVMVLEAPPTCKSSIKRYQDLHKNKVSLGDACRWLEKEISHIFSRIFAVFPTSKFSNP